MGTAVLNTNLSPGNWTSIPSIFRLEMSGTGTITLDSKDTQGNITLAVFEETLNNAVNEIGFPYAGDSAIAIRATFTGTASARILR